MRLPASEKLEIIHLVEQSHLPARIKRCNGARPTGTQPTRAGNQVPTRPATTSLNHRSIDLEGP